MTSEERAILTAVLRALFYCVVMAAIMLYVVWLAGRGLGIWT